MQSNQVRDISMGAMTPEFLKEAKSYFAVQATRGELPKDVVRLVITTAANHGISFRYVETLDLMTVGSATLVRLRSTITDPSELLDKLAQAGRSVIYSCQGVYQMKGARKGIVPLTRMQATPCLSGERRVYAGSAHPHWRRQFEDN